MKKSQLNKRETADLKMLLPRGADIWTYTQSVAASGLSRRINFYTIYKWPGDPKPIILRLNYYIGRALGIEGDLSEGIRLRGAGVDLGGQAVEMLSWVLYGRGDALGHERL